MFELSISEDASFTYLALFICCIKGAEEKEDAGEEVACQTRAWGGFLSR